MIALKCPSCGASLEIPTSLSVAHCMHCGTKVILPKQDSLQNEQRLSHLRELCAVAFAAGNYKEALQYCNSILKLVPGDGLVWIDKAIAVFYLETAAKDTFGEALEYLSKAESLNEELLSLTT